MIILYEPKDSPSINSRQQITSTCQNFGELFKIINSLEDLPEGDLVCCVEKQAMGMLPNTINVEILSKFIHTTHSHYLFGPNIGTLMADVIKGEEHKFRFLTIDSPFNNVFWVEQAIAIILYDRWANSRKV